MNKDVYPGLYDQFGTDLPFIVADEDFIEHLHELGFEDSIDINDLIFEWLDWSSENIEA